LQYYLSKEIESKYYEHEIKRLSNRKRKRDVGAGRPFKPKLRERFLMLLVYYRLYITFTLSGFLFDLDQSNVCRDICMLEPLVKLCIPLPKKLYKCVKKLIEEVDEYFPGFKAFIDSAEQVKDFLFYYFFDGQRFLITILSLVKFFSEFKCAIGFPAYRYINPLIIIWLRFIFSFSRSIT